MTTFPGVGMLEVAATVACRFTVDARLKVLRAGEVIPYVESILRVHSLARFPLLCRRPELRDRRGGDG